MAESWGVALKIQIERPEQEVFRLRPYMWMYDEPFETAILKIKQLYPHFTDLLEGICYLTVCGVGHCILEPQDKPCQIRGFVNGPDANVRILFPGAMTASFHVHLLAVQSMQRLFPHKQLVPPQWIDSQHWKEKMDAVCLLEQQIQTILRPLLTLAKCSRPPPRGWSASPMNVTVSEVDMADTEVIESPSDSAFSVGDSQAAPLLYPGEDRTEKENGAPPQCPRAPAFSLPSLSAEVLTRPCSELARTESRLASVHADARLATPRPSSELRKASPRSLKEVCEASSDSDSWSKVWIEERLRLKRRLEEIEQQQKKRIQDEQTQRLRFINAQLQKNAARLPQLAESPVQRLVGAGKTSLQRNQ